jgi:hypothetical protein
MQLRNRLSWSAENCHVTLLILNSDTALLVVSGTEVNEERVYVQNHVVW